MVSYQLKEALKPTFPPCSGAQSLRKDTCVGALDKIASILSADWATPPALCRSLSFSPHCTLLQRRKGGKVGAGQDHLPHRKGWAANTGKISSWEDLGRVPHPPLCCRFLQAAHFPRLSWSWGPEEKLEFWSSVTAFTLDLFKWLWVRTFSSSFVSGIFFSVAWLMVSFNCLSIGILQFKKSFIQVLYIIFKKALKVFNTVFFSFVITFFFKNYTSDTWVYSCMKLKFIQFK